MYLIRRDADGYEFCQIEQVAGSRNYANGLFSMGDSPDLVEAQRRAPAELAELDDDDSRMLKRVPDWDYRAAAIRYDIKWLRIRLDVLARAKAEGCPVVDPQGPSGSRHPVSRHGAVGIDPLPAYRSSDAIRITRYFNFVDFSELLIIHHVVDYAERCDKIKK